jgi:Fe-S-cluster containining protein
VALPDDAPACARWEAAQDLSCRTCGACCREAYHSVEVAPTEAVNRRHPALVERRETYRRLRRQGERCAALAGTGTPAAPFECTIYPDRPRACREFERGGTHCLEARRRVGLSL